MSLRIGPGRCTLGRNPGNQLALSDPDRLVSGRHAEIDLRPDGAWITDKSTNGTYLNGSLERLPPDQPVRIQDGDMLSVGPYEISVALIASAPAAAPIADPFAVGPTADHGLPGIATPGGAPDIMALLGGTPGQPSPRAVPPRNPFADAQALDAALGGPAAEAEPAGAPHRPTPMEHAFFRPPDTQPIPDDFDLLAGLPPAPGSAPGSVPGFAAASVAFQEPQFVDPFGQAPSALERKPGPAAPPDRPQPPPPTEAVDSVDSADASELTSPTTRPQEAEGPGTGRFAPWASASLLKAMPPQPQPQPQPERQQPPQPQAPSAPQPPAAGPGPDSRPAGPGAGPSAQAPIPRPAPTGNAPQGDARAGVAALLAGLGTGDPAQVQDPQALLHTAGALLRAMTAGLSATMMARARFKSELRVGMTTLRPTENNPFKFSVGPDDALERLLLRPNPGFLPPLEAAREAFDDIQAHEMATLAGLRGALRALLARFEPAALEALLDPASGLDKVLPMARKSRYWEAFTEAYGRVAADAEDDFMQVFGEAFTHAYEDQIARLAQARKQRPPG